MSLFFVVLRLLNFIEECDSTHKSDISLILYPIFVHVYLDLVAGGHSEMGKDRRALMLSYTNTLFKIS